MASYSCWTPRTSDSLAPPDQRLAGIGRQRLRGDVRASSLRDLAIDQLEQVQVGQHPVIPFEQILLDAQDAGALR